MNDFLEFDILLLEGFFNWMVIFKRELDFYLFYGSYVSLLFVEKLLKLFINYVVKKIKFVMWVVFWCGRI